jgi:putative tryptophan/tyrosine transport system substrate-binding protein
VTWFTPAAQAAKGATREIPIVIALAGDPVANGLVVSLNRPGGNVTGMSGVSAELGGKGVELIREMLPSPHRVVALANAPDPFSRPFLEQIEVGRRATGIVIDAKILRSPEELEVAFADMGKERPDAVIVQLSLPTKRAVELGAKYKIPTVSTLRLFAEQGGLMSYGPVLAYLYRRAAVYADKILKGAKPGDLPVEQPTQFELIIKKRDATSVSCSFGPRGSASARLRWLANLSRRTSISLSPSATPPSEPRNARRRRSPLSP